MMLILYSSFKVQLYFPIQGLAVIVKKNFTAPAKPFIGNMGMCHLRFIKNFPILVPLPFQCENHIPNSLPKGINPIPCKYPNWNSHWQALPLSFYFCTIYHDYYIYIKITDFLNYVLMFIPINWFFSNLGITLFLPYNQNEWRDNVIPAMTTL